ncbi:SIMPL domain-containing protein [Solwaraspora sp. WMMA2080]|uniref:SIMPL domain-containing protein n=1 Tax=unclassified Solwaraspora TaxID=2627926 RepID=UPI00248BE3F8|nr:MULTISPECIES: SIMPL domain-containing protein [unclassified Solwaraspora]WBB97962.1 SIMPL domain-containing protein [Solwaraspora sp. WMMA2059]WBC23479.1 SIMPL domain-containing protein [Solwaraspora sp. WMMA2080]
MDAPVVAVRGEVTREVPPELARFGVTAVARGKDRSGTLARLAERGDTVRTLIDGYGPAIERRESGALLVRPEWRRSGERVIAYHASVTTTVTVVDFTVLGELMMRLAGQDQVQVSGPWWSLRPTSPELGQARRAAIAEAITRARDYADALGAEVTGLVELADHGMSAPQPVMLRGAPRAFAATEMADPAPQLDLDPQVQTVQAVVEARFTISAPAVLRPS